MHIYRVVAEHLGSLLVMYWTGKYALKYTNKKQRVQKADMLYCKLNYPLSCL